MNKKLRYVLTYDCDRNCAGCCNKDHAKPNRIPWLIALRDYDEIYITGGEPLLNVDRIVEKIAFVHNYTNIGNHPKFFIYSAKADDLGAWWKILPYIDGITFTLHTQEDVKNFGAFEDLLFEYLCKEIRPLSLRLNVFAGIEYDVSLVTEWKIKDNMEWIKDCPIPTGEDFKRSFDA